MIHPSRRASAFWTSMVVFLFAAATAAYSQAPTDAQRSAIRSQCRADYEAHCSSIPPGGKASLQCLQQNMSSLSSGCQAAVRAIEGSAAPKAESTPVAPAKSTPAASTAKPATEAATPPAASNPPPASNAGKKPSSAQVTAIRSACRNDYQKNCAGVPTGGAAALSCLQKIETISHQLLFHRFEGGSNRTGSGKEAQGRGAAMQQQARGRVQGD